MKACLPKWLLATLFVGLSVQVVLAQDFPSKVVTMVIPFPPGGGNDTVGRYVADELSKKWGKKVVIENRGGAGGAIGAGAVARSAPDGYTVLFNSSSYTINAVTTPLTFDPVNDLSLVVTTGVTDTVITVAKHIPANSISELIAFGKQRRLLSPNMNVFPTLLLADATGLDLLSVPYKGVGDITPELLSGRADIYIGSATYAAPLLADKQIKVLATMGRERSKNLPDVPTMAELGYTGAEMELWWGVFVPSKTPREIKEQINRDVAEIMARPDSIEFLRKFDARPMTIRLDDGYELVKSEIGRWKMLGVKYNIGTRPN